MEDGRNLTCSDYAERGICDDAHRRLKVAALLPKKRGYFGCACGGGWSDGATLPKNQEIWGLSRGACGCCLLPPAVPYPPATLPPIFDMRWSAGILKDHRRWRSSARGRRCNYSYRWKMSTQRSIQLYRGQRDPITKESGAAREAPHIYPNFLNIVIW